ncbi:MAG: CCA tRNA nucleotidyltransferase, partial [Spirochaetales bacterium]|nr:CCA tRNA nucleotidyltransferase [Spirochaetales bacterium]
MKHFYVNPTLRHFSNIFSLNGYSCFLVGGALRNHFAGMKATDFDFATDANPEDVQRIFNQVIPTGIKHGTVTVIFKGHQFEVTTFRIEGNYSNSRHPDQISFSPSIFEDLKRRDFSINSIAMNLLTGEVLDPHNGIQDLKHKIIRAIGDPVERFTEDGLRLMRACRFTSQLNFKIEEKTFQAIKECKNNLKMVSSERIRDEILKILGSDKPSIAFKIMEESGILNIVIPELSTCRGVLQKGFHDFDVLDHLFYSCDGGPKDDKILRFACLLHDTGKPLSLSTDSDGFPTFYHHDKISTELAVKIMQSLRFSGSEIKRAAHLISNHMFNYTEDWTDAAVRRFISKVGIDNIDDLFKMRMADQFGMTNSKIYSEKLNSFTNRINNVLTENNAFTIKDLNISGTDLQTECGIKKGPFIGNILKELLETVLDDPSLNNREIL